MDRVTLIDRTQQRMKRPSRPPTPAGKKPKAERNRLSSVATAIRLLKAFSEEEDELGVSALAHKLGVAKSTVHRLAVTLVSEGLLEQDPKTDRYRLGIGLFGLGTLVRRRMDLSTEARPFLFDLRARTGETILLGIPAETEVMYVYNLESPQALRMRSDIGVRRPAYCTAIGRAILAFAPGATRGPRAGRPAGPPHAQDRDRQGRPARDLRGGARARLRDRGRGERARHPLHRGSRCGGRATRWWARSGSPVRRSVCRWKCWRSCPSR